jgi:O-antigen ligase
MSLSLFFFGLSFATVSFTSLRFAGPIGFSEVFLVVSFVTMLIKENRRLILFDSNLATLFWAPFFILMTAGYLLTVIKGIHELGKSSHDYFAFLFCFVSSIVFYNLVNRHGVINVVKWLAKVGLISCFCLLVIVPVITGAAGKLFLFRYSGFSHNPNQLALFSLICLFFSVFLYETQSKDERRKWPCIIAASMSLLCGILSQSDALSLALVVSLVLIGGAVTIRYAVLPCSPFKKLSALFFLLMLLIGGVNLSDVILETLMSMRDDGGQGSVRLTLWKHGVEAMFTSPIWGVGPGAWSGLSHALEGHEAHNTVIDFANSYGLIGLFMYFTIIVLSLKAMYKANMMLSLMLFLSLQFFSLFHYVLRLPFMWAVLFLPLLIFKKTK